MKQPSLVKRFGELVRNLRLTAGLSQEALADKCGLHRTYVGAIERGEKAVTIETAEKLATGLDLSLSDLFARLDASLGVTQKRGAR